MLRSCVLNKTKGGAVPFASDGLDSLSPTRRTAAFQKSVSNETTRSRYYDLFFGDANMTGSFPGMACHNHANVYEMGPLKEDWTQPCPLDWAQSEREEKCISQGVSFWGTENLARLEAFKKTIDPNGIFICAAGIGYSNPAGAADVADGGEMEGGETESETETEDGNEGIGGGETAMGDGETPEPESADVGMPGNETGSETGGIIEISDSED